MAESPNHNRLILNHALLLYLSLVQRLTEHGWNKGAGLITDIDYTCLATWLEVKPSLVAKRNLVRLEACTTPNWVLVERFNISYYEQAIYNSYLIQNYFIKEVEYLP